MVNRMCIQKNMLLHIGGEVFLFTTSQLSREQLLDIESLVEAAFDDYDDEIEEMSIYQLCEWFQNKAKELYGIELENAPIDYEIKMRATK